MNPVCLAFRRTERQGLMPSASSQTRGMLSTTWWHWQVARHQLLRKVAKSQHTTLAKLRSAQAAMEHIQNMYNHKCPGKSSDVKIKGSKIRYETLENLSGQDSGDLVREVISRMNNGTIKSTIQGDETILLYGGKLYAKYRDRPHFLAHVAEKMREVARLLIAAKNIQPSIHNLDELLQPRNWDIIIKAAQQAANFEPKNQYFRHPLSRNKTRPKFN
ncbi:Glycerol-3-phosphate acyltransferase [Frankliniella fusca]|uniref:Glycerol-3-phosphate acyltransferase n=1 Tax=Frankliniella fusca TaxID=407009 RepID=A0AAE1H6W7_9NEOP|nr:Glycerol-3-phosphate acyltransferase [Frankliniella fusca]